MAVSPSCSSATLPYNLQPCKNFLPSHTAPIIFHAKYLLSSPKPNNTTTSTHIILSPNKLFDLADSWKWRTQVSFFTGFLTKGRNAESLKEELYAAIAPLDRGAEATPEDQQLVEQVGASFQPLCDFALFHSSIPQFCFLVWSFFFYGTKAESSCPIVMPGCDALWDFEFIIYGINGWM